MKFNYPLQVAGDSTIADEGTEIKTAGKWS